MRLHTIGSYRGVRFATRRICEVFPHLDSRAVRLFDYLDGEPTGNHFETMREFRQYVDELIEGSPRTVGRFIPIPKHSRKGVRHD